LPEAQGVNHRRRLVHSVDAITGPHDIAVFVRPRHPVIGPLGPEVPPHYIIAVLVPRDFLFAPCLVACIQTKQAPGRSSGSVQRKEGNKMRCLRPNCREEKARRQPVSARDPGRPPTAGDRLSWRQPLPHQGKPGWNRSLRRPHEVPRPHAARIECGPGKPCHSVRSPNLLQVPCHLIGSPHSGVQSRLVFPGKNSGTKQESSKAETTRKIRRHNRGCPLLRQ